MMASKPLFADSWYDEPRISELRQEIQNLYRLLEEKEAEIAALEERVAVLEP